MRKILTININKEIQEEVQKEFGPSGFTIESTEFIKEAVHLISKNKISLILLNTRLPDLKDYHEFCLLMKSHEELAKIPIILFSESKDEKVPKVEVLRTAMVNDYFVLPFPMEEILARINIFLEIKMLQEELELKNALLKKISITDDLTKTYNRRYLMDRLREEITSMLRYKYELSCLIIDVDNFKYINDNFGHLKGDEVLRVMSGIFKRNIRSVDIMGRYGGEEFLIILPFTDEEGAVIVAERLRATVMDFNFGTKEESLYVTLSIGSVSFSHHDSIDAQKVIKTADEQLYRAKQSGKNKVCSSTYSRIEHKL